MHYASPDSFSFWCNLYSHPRRSHRMNIKGVLELRAWVTSFRLVWWEGARIVRVYCCYIFTNLFVIIILIIHVLYKLCKRYCRCASSCASSPDRAELFNYNDTSDYIYKMIYIYTFFFQLNEYSPKRPLLREPFWAFPCGINDKRIRSHNYPTILSRSFICLICLLFMPAL